MVSKDAERVSEVKAVARLAAGGERCVRSLMREGENHYGRTPLSTQCIDLLDLFLDDAYETGHQDLPVRQAFVYRHARNISEIAEDVLTLETDDRISSCLRICASVERLTGRCAGIVNFRVSVKVCF